MEVTREKLVTELATTDVPAEDFGGKIAKLKAQFNPENTEIAIRRLLFLARDNADEHAKRGLMPILRQLVQKVVIGKTQGHQPASLQVHGLIAAIFAQMDVIDYMSSRFMSEVHEDFIERVEASDIDSEEKKEIMLDIYRDEFLERLPEWENLQMSLVAGA